MAAVLLALYDQPATAEKVRTELVSDGFPTDRVQLTSTAEPGAAGMVPADSRVQRLREYFGTLFDGDEQRRHADFFAERVNAGGATVTVHPRGEREIARAKEILERNGPAELGRQHLDDTGLEQAASNRNRPLIERVLAGMRTH